jgi:hypothetical protein
MRDHSLLLCGDQGILNLLVFRGAAEGRLSVATAPLQAVVPVIPRADLERRFRLTGEGPVIRPEDEVVIHWAGAKPFTLAFLGSILLWWEEWWADYRQAMPPGLLSVLRRTKRRFVNLLSRRTTPAEGERLIVPAPRRMSR